MNLTQEQIKIVTGEKCPNQYHNIRNSNDSLPCGLCGIPLRYNGLPTIEIEKEWIKCSHMGYWDIRHCYSCKGKGKIPKFKVGEEIRIDCPLLVTDTKDVLGHKGLLENCSYHCYGGTLKLKIISETETHQKLQRVK